MSTNDVNFLERPGGIPTNVQYYVLRQAPGGDPTDVYFTKGPISQGSPTDSPIAINVLVDCTICIQLDPAGNWQYQTGTPLSLGATGEESRYYNMSESVGDMQAQFGADYYTGGPAGNLDPFNIFVLASGTEYRIDPDIKNPGDPGG